MLIDKSVSFEQLKKIAGQAEQRLLKKVDIFDVYEGDKLPAGKKSYALSFILMDEEKTLQDQIIDGVMDKLIKSYEKEVGAEIRKA
jgi:phenylalanyl-tRNA synthetase beta chain